MTVRPNPRTAPFRAGVVLICGRRPGLDTDWIKSDVVRVSPESGHWWAIYEYTPLTP
jgi:hypothetical protein